MLKNDEIQKMKKKSDEIHQGSTGGKPIDFINGETPLVKRQSKR